MLFLPFKILRVRGHSMEPKFKDGSYALVRLGSTLGLSVGDVFVLESPNGLILKRIANIDDRGYQVIGDNQHDSLDSRDFGLIQLIYPFIQTYT